MTCENAQAADATSAAHEAYFSLLAEVLANTPNSDLQPNNILGPRPDPLPPACSNKSGNIVQFRHSPPRTNSKAAFKASDPQLTLPTNLPFSEDCEKELIRAWPHCN
jgi:hypothetical protein